MTAVLHDLRPAIMRGSGTHRKPGPRLRAGDLVSWTNPNTGEVWSELQVECVLKGSGTVNVRGWFGRLHRKSGDCVTESRTVRGCDLVVSAVASEAC